MNWKQLYQNKLVSVEEAATKIRSGDRIAAAPACSIPEGLVKAISDRWRELEDVTISSMLMLYPFEYLKGECAGHIRHHSLFLGPFERKLYNQGNMDITSYSFSQTDWLIRNRIKPNVGISEVSPPDENGNMSCGPVGAEYSAAVLDCADTVVVQVNRETPYVHGVKEAFINVADATWICECDHKVPEFSQPTASDVDRQIASHVLEYIDDGDTLQLGIGGVANAVGFSLDRFKDLGVHTEMLTDSMMDLVNKGVITGRKKTLHPGEITIAFGMGSTELYQFMDRNPDIKAYPLSYITDPRVIGQNKNFVSINSTLMCDLTGQACSESIGFDQFSCSGGQLDFVRGAGYSEGGRSFICFPSTARTTDGAVKSRINVALPPGAVVTTPRTDVQYFATEYGVADLRCRSIGERVAALINIAHPQFRDELVAGARETGLITRSQRIRA